MNRLFKNLASVGIVALLLVGAFNVNSDEPMYGGAEDVAYANKIWDTLVEENLAGDNAMDDQPYIGTHPHGAILETTIETITIDGFESMVVTKRSYRGEGVSVASVSDSRDKFLVDITIMFKREKNYDPDNKDWFWAKYETDGTLSETPNGIPLAGKIGKGKPKGCIACHRKADGDDYLFVM